MPDRPLAHDPPIISEGTQVVTRTGVRPIGSNTELPPGSVGVVIQSPADASHSYFVRFNGGPEAVADRCDLAVLKSFKWPSLAAASNEVDLHSCVIYRCVVGSRAYGLEGPDSDTDRRGIYLPPADLEWSLFNVPEQLEDHQTQECYWELKKFLTLALKANPNSLECLYTPLVEYVLPLAEDLLAMREIFLSKLVYQTYNGYVMSQFKKLDHDIRKRGEIKWKHAMHLIRILLSGIVILEEGYVPVRIEQHRDRLLAIRSGRLPWDEINTWRVELHKRFDEAFLATALPDRPDYARANTFLIRARGQKAREWEEHDGVGSACP
ncbi:MAG TPA: nucleotidyltransferase domain-containing protein [Blastocatellia bacterium]|nr:nucleotidyltransferase domain-containing protein [Blastocatellia bacterium]